MKRQSRSPRHAPIAKIIWTMGFLVGTVTHTLDIYHGGWLPYEFASLPFNIYWTSLTFLDPFAALLIWLRERWGVWLGVAIMLSNVLVNGYMAFIVGREEFYFGFAFQSVFAVFVFALAGQRWWAVKRGAATS